YGMRSVVTRAPLTLSRGAMLSWRPTPAGTRPADLGPPHPSLRSPPHGPRPAAPVASVSPPRLSAHRTRRFGLGAFPKPPDLASNLNSERSQCIWEEFSNMPERAESPMSRSAKGSGEPWKEDLDLTTRRLRAV